MPGEENLVIQRGAVLDYERLCSAVQNPPCDVPPEGIQLEVLAELRACRAQVSYPLDPATDRLPSPDARARMSNVGDGSIVLDSDDMLSNTIASKSSTRLGADLVSVALALSDELQINELDAAVLLFDARTRASHRADHDVVAAAKELYAVRRRECVQYLQEVIRAALVAPTGNPTNEDSFISLLMRERDVLFVEYNVFSNIAKRLRAGFEAAKATNLPRRDQGNLYYGEYLLLAETLFLLSYTLQLSSAEALILRKLMEAAEEFFSRIVQQDKYHGKPTRSGLSSSSPQDINSTGSSSLPSHIVSREAVEAEGVCNLLILAWMSSLDRSRYHDMYDPRAGVVGVNSLLKDMSFLPQTSGMPAPGGNDEAVRNMPSRIAAAELVAAVFRLAVASPDEEEAVGTFLRVSAYAGALSFLSADVSTWIESRGGSLSPDVSLYADVLEDLALDIAEASHLVGAVIQFSQNEVYAAASEAAYASLEGGDGNLQQVSRRARNSLSSLPEVRDSALSRKGRGSAGYRLSSDYDKQISTIGSSSTARPPLQPSSRIASRSLSVRDVSSGTSINNQRSSIESGNNRIGGKKSTMTNVTTSENLISSLATFVARSIALAPSKLTNDSIGGGIRYWVGIGPANLGFIPRIGDAVTDLWDACMRNAYASGGVGLAFREALEGFLALLKNTSLKNGSPTHAAAALRYLSQGGHPVVSLERTSDAMSYIQSQMTGLSSSRQKELDDAEADALRGIIDVIGNAADAVSSQSGVLPILGDAGKELPLRMASLAVLDIPARLKATLLYAVNTIQNKRAVALALKSFARDKSAMLRRFIRTWESQTGVYDVTLRVLELTNRAVQWSDDEMPESAVESITTWFVIEEVLMYWNRRKYSMETYRWRVMSAAANLVLSVVKRNPSSLSSRRVLARLLTPASGTGSASSALKALFSASGLMRTNEESAHSSSEDIFSHNNRGFHKLFGKNCLTYAAEHGFGDSFREMQKAAQSAARLNTELLSVPPGRLAIPGVVVASTSALILGETRAMAAAATLVFLANGFYPSISKAGYNPAVCASVLAMLAKATQESHQIGLALTRDILGCKGSAAQFRSSLADLISQSTNVLSHGGEMELTAPGAEIPPIMHSALRIVEATLGADGGGAPGLFLLGLQSDSAGRYRSSQYGILGALIELVAGSLDITDALDNKSRATASTFLERLAANTRRHTSIGVLEHIRQIAEDDVGIRGSGFGDEILLRILESYGHSEPGKDIRATNWVALGETMASCIKLSALQVRVFPQFELDKIANSERSSLRSASLNRDRDGAPWQLVSHIPSPLELLRTLSVIASSGELRAAFEGLCSWYLLLGTRIATHSAHSGYSSVPILLEIASVLLDAIASPDSTQGLSKLVRNDGGEVASAAVLLCVNRLRDCANSQTREASQLIGGIQYSSLLNGIVRALAGSIGVSANAVRARTALYGAFVMCGPAAQKTGSEEILSRSLGGRLGQRQVCGTEGIITVACKDAISGPSTAARCAAITAISVSASLDPIRAIPSLAAQNRLDRIMQISLSNSDVRVAASQVYHENQPILDSEYERNDDRAASALIDASLCLIHSVAASGHGAGLLADAGCVEALRSLLQRISSQAPQSLSMVVDQDGRSRARDKMGTSSTPFDHSLPGRESEKYDEEMTDSDYFDGLGSGRERKRPISPEILLVSVTSTLAAVVCSGGPPVHDEAVIALDECRSMYMELLKGRQMLGREQLEIAGSLGLILSRIPRDSLVTTGGNLLRVILASSLSAIIPATSRSRHLGGSGSLFSAGSNMFKPGNVRDARRSRISHPEGGSLLERDMMYNRALCMKNVLAAIRDPDRVLQLFIPQLSDSTSYEIVRKGRKSSSPELVGRLSEVLRICKITLNEVQRAAEEGMLMERSVSGEIGSALSPKRLKEISTFCGEEYRVEADPTSLSTIHDCLKKAVLAIRQHAETCITIFESGLLILREYVRSAQETVRGRAGTVGMDISGRDAEERPPLIGFVEAKSLLEDAESALVPLCKEVEGLQESLWCGRDASFAKQICRQIRTACSIHAH